MLREGGGACSLPEVGGGGAPGQFQGALEIAAVLHVPYDCLISGLDCLISSLDCLTCAMCTRATGAAARRDSSKVLPALTPPLRRPSSVLPLCSPHSVFPCGETHTLNHTPLSRRRAGTVPRGCPCCCYVERESSFIDNLLVRIHLTIVMISVDRPCAMGA